MNEKSREKEKKNESSQDQLERDSVNKLCAKCTIYWNETTFNQQQGKEREYE